MNSAGIIDEHLSKIQDFYERAPATVSVTQAALEYRRLLAHYYRLMIPTEASVLEIGCGGGDLLAMLPNRDVTGVDLSAAQLEQARQRVPHGTFSMQAGERLKLDRVFDVIILSETINYAADVQQIIEQLHSVSAPHTRLILNFFSSLWRPVLALATAVGLKAPSPQSNWLSHKDVWNLCNLADWEVIKTQQRILCPAPLPFGLDTPLNRLFAPVIPFLCLTVFVVARPRPRLPLPPAAPPARQHRVSCQAHRRTGWRHGVDLYRRKLFRPHLAGNRARGGTLSRTPDQDHAPEREGEGERRARGICRRHRGHPHDP